MSDRIVIVAALEREVASLVSGWQATQAASSRGKVSLYERERALVAVGGIGAIFARAAADLAYQHCQGRVGLLVSAGLAGALTPEWKVGEIFTPATIVDDADGLAIQTGTGAGTLITAGTIADATIKSLLAAKHIAQAVDMEAYAVADVARIHGVPFRAIKAISDELDFPMPALGRFIAVNGTFQTRAYALHAALRPWLWPTLIRLGSNSRKAANALCNELRALIDQFGLADRYNRLTTRP